MSTNPRSKNGNTLVFDLDGALVDTFADIILSMQQVFKDAGLEPPTTGAIQQALGPGIDDVFRTLAPQHHATLLAAYKVYYPLHCTDTSAVQPGVFEVLSTLRRRGYTLAIATTKIPAFAQATCDGLGLTPYFDVIQGTEGFAAKPSPEVVLRALKRAGGRGLWMIGDTGKDVLAGRAAGLKTYAVSWGTEPASVLAKANPDVLAADLAQLLVLTA